MTVIVDMGIGNLGAFANMLRRVGASARVSGDPDVVARADRLILPGVGHFDYAMRGLRERGLEPVLRHKALIERVPILGVCLGMQIMFEGSEEGTEPGLGWLRGGARRLDGGTMPGRPLPIPHMGWNAIWPTRRSSLLQPQEALRFYFIHSYHVCCADDLVSARAVYGQPLVAAVERRNLLGCQFHPEKSHRFGKLLLERFARLSPAVGYRLAPAA